MMFWGDIILHNPELIPELPADAVCLNWGYEANHPFARETAAFRRAKRRFIVCPGTSAWGSLSGRTANMMANVDNAVTNGLKNGMSGLMVADWGDGGHPNPWIVSVPAIVYAAHRMRGETLSRAQLAAEIDRALGCRCGEALLAYGDIYGNADGWAARRLARRISARRSSRNTDGCGCGRIAPEVLTFRWSACSVGKERCSHRHEPLAG